VNHTLVILNFAGDEAPHHSPHLGSPFTARDDRRDVRQGHVVFRLGPFRRGELSGQRLGNRRERGVVFVQGVADAHEANNEGRSAVRNDREAECLCVVEAGGTTLTAHKMGRDGRVKLSRQKSLIPRPYKLAVRQSRNFATAAPASCGIVIKEIELVGLIRHGFFCSDSGSSVF
jgi:hypothetical protein